MRWDSDPHCSEFETDASCQLGYASIGSSDGIRTHTVMHLKHVTLPKLVYGTIVKGRT